MAVRSTDQRRGDPSSFLPLTRGDTATWFVTNSSNQTRQLETSFYYERGECILTNMGGKVHVNKTRIRRGGGVGGNRFSTSLNVDLDPPSILCFRNGQRQHTIHQLGRHLVCVDLRRQSDAASECRVSGRLTLNRDFGRLG